jgi:hypothetical protein
VAERQYVLIGRSSWLLGGWLFISAIGFAQLVAGATLACSGRYGYLLLTDRIKSVAWLRMVDGPTEVAVLLMCSGILAAMSAYVGLRRALQGRRSLRWAAGLVGGSCTLIALGVAVFVHEYVSNPVTRQLARPLSLRRCSRRPPHAGWCRRCTYRCS